MPVEAVPTPLSDVVSYMDFLEVAPVATVSIVVLVIFYRVGMRLCDIIEKREK